MTSIKTLMIEAIGELDHYSFDKLVECTLRASSIKEDQECWCLSGKEYKACHKNRHLKKELNYYEIRDKISGIFDNKKYCCAQFDKNNCDLKIKMAHTIQRGKVLSSLAESGHVGTFYRKLDGIANTNKLKAGIEKRASVFYGFCSYHDTELFKNIELHEFTKTKEKCWASSYRAVCHEFYQKNAAIEVTNWQRDNLDNGLDTYLQVFVQEKIFLHQRDVTKGFDDISLIKKNYEEIKVTSSFDDLVSYVFEYDSPLTIAVCACISPFFDINNKKIQNKGNGKESFQHLSLSTVTINGKAAYVISHLKKHDVIGKYLEEVLSKPLEYINNWLMTCIFAYTENNYFRLSWWDSLDTNTKDGIYNLFLSENYTRIINYDTPVGQSIPCKLIAVERI